MRSRLDAVLVGIKDSNFSGMARKNKKYLRRGKHNVLGGAQVLVHCKLWSLYALDLTPLELSVRMNKPNCSHSVAVESFGMYASIWKGTLGA